MDSKQPLVQHRLNWSLHCAETAAGQADVSCGHSSDTHMAAASICALLLHFIKTGPVKVSKANPPALQPEVQLLAVSQHSSVKGESS